MRAVEVRVLSWADRGVPLCKRSSSRPISACGTSLPTARPSTSASAGHGPAVVLLHGYGETGDMWAPMAADLVRDRTVVVPDLRGMGLSVQASRRLRQEDTRPPTSPVFSTRLKHRACRSRHPRHRQHGRLRLRGAVSATASRRFVLIDAPVAGVGPWEEVLKNPLLWHFRFGGPDMERLVAGRERIYLDRFWNEFSATSGAVHRGRARALRGTLRAAQAPCIPASPSSPPSIRTLSTTRRF